MKKPNKWIAKKIESLDPHKDYIEIWRLSSSYRLNDFMQNFIYALTFPNFIVTDWGSKVVWREDGGKVLHRSTSRAEQTSSANALWWFYGPNDERTIKSVDSINKLHAYWAKQYPGVFSYNEDYVYTLAFSAILMHRLKLKMGAPGISEKEKIAAHLFWRDMSKLFYAENGQPITDYPDSFEELVEYCEQYENTPRPTPERANLVAKAIYEQFVFRFFPPQLHWFGHQLIRSMSLPTTLKTLGIDPPDPMAAEILPRLMGYIFWQIEENTDDPTESYIEERLRMSSEDKKSIRREIKNLDERFPDHFSQQYKKDLKFSGCPYHAALEEIASNKKSNNENYFIEELEKNSGALD
ncbi:hypothetical protein [Vreelandella glaciei]|uniref:hypothetical protein n=1 Tax=Vreelandella glaciei TaxID=186761 RepID=UPI0030EB2775|tara:strand:+ start:13560 stop:14618 length:1059 start_codon:yes stop_codon:yes gene_type:complete